MKKLFMKICHVFISFVLVGVLVSLTSCKGKKLLEYDVTSGYSDAYRADDGERYELEVEIKAEDLEKVTVEQATSEGKIILYMSISGTENTPIRNVVNLFNTENEKYYVDLTVCQIGSTLNDTRMRLQTEIMAGGGPDIMSEDLFEITQEIIDKGYLVNLKPMLIKSEMIEKKYFPGYIKYKNQDGIFSISLEESISGRVIRREVLESDELPDIETLVDALLNFPQKAAFYNSYQSATRIMDYFLCGSENLWGCIDWEEKKCDFSGELFSKIMDVSKMYWENREYDPIMEGHNYSIGLYGGHDDLLKNKKVELDYFFDDGNYPIINNTMTTLFINANSKNIEGAWTFLSFALSRNGQNVILNPVHREVFAEKAKTKMEILAGEYDDVSMFMMVPLTENILNDIIDANNRASYLPVKTKEILAIIYDEADAFFLGCKTKKEVINIIQNRVQLYLDEI